MKSIKRLIVFILIMALCTSLVSVASAKSDMHGNNNGKDSKTQDVLSADVQILKTLGLLLGSGKDGLTLEYTKSKPTRIQGLIINLRLINEEINLNQFVYHHGDKNFDDHDGYSDYVQKGMAFAKAHSEFSWIGSNGRFNPMAHLTAREYAKVMLTVLGYEYNTDYNWNNVESFAESLGLNVPEGAFTFETLATMTVQTLYMAMKGTSTTLIAYLASVNAEFAAKVALLENTTAPDETKPTVTDVVLSAPYVAGPPVVNGQVTVYFSEAMNATTLTNLANYTVDLNGTTTAGTSLSLISGAAAVPAADKQSVTLTIPGSALSGGTAAGVGITDITLSGLTDLAGNTIVTVTLFVRKAATLTVQASAAVDVNKLQVTFNNPMASIGATEFKLYRSDGMTLAAVGSSFVLDATGKIVTITLGSNLTSSAKAIASDLTTAKLVIGTATTKDIFGNAVSGAVVVADVSITPATVIIDDKIVPVIISRQTQDLDNDGYLDAVKLTFSKNIKDSSVNAGSFDVTGFGLETFSPTTSGDIVNNDIIYITFSESGVADTGTTPTIAYTQGTLEDSAGNKLASTGAVVTTDKAVPVVMTALPAGALTAGSAASSAALVLSEALTTVSKDAVAAAIYAHITPYDLTATGDIVWTYVWTTNTLLSVSISANANGGVNPDYIALTVVTADLIDAAGNIAAAAQVIE